MNSLTQKTIFVGIDWADQTHAWHLQSGQAQTSGLLQQDANAIDDWVNQLGKNDPGDALLLCQYLRHYIEKLRPLRRDRPLTRKLAAMAEDRRRLVDQRTAHCNELKAVLKTYFPEVLKLEAARIYADFIVVFLLKYPNLAFAQKAGAGKLRKLFYGVGTRAKAEKRVQLLVEALPLSSDPALNQTCSMRVTALASLIQTYNAQIRVYAARIAEEVVKHQDYAIFKSLPGASDLTHSRMIAAMGDDRSRYENANSLQAATGIAPLTTQSGKQRFVSARWACTKFLKQTFHEFAGLSITSSKWAAAYYKLQLDKGKSPQMAKRALAYKWQRIIFRCWHDRVPYDEARYIARLKETGSPIYKLIKA